jgi:mannosyltransferase
VNPVGSTVPVTSVPAPGPGTIAGPASRNVLLAHLAVLVTSLTVFTWRIGTPAPWRDELITLAAAERPVGAILRTTENLDRAHVLYYLVVRVLAGPDASSDPSLVRVRLVSVVAGSLTCLLLVEIGRRLGGTVLGVVSALVLAVSPLTSRYAQEARSYALVMLCCAASTLVLLVATGRRRGAGWTWFLYTALLIFGAMLNVLALLVVPAHGAYLVVAERRALRQWLGPATVAGLCALPMVWALAGQQKQVAWLGTISVADLAPFFRAQYPSAASLAALVVALLASRPSRYPRALALGVAWGVLPVVLLWAVSLVHPLFAWRYVVFSLPGLALLVGALVAGARLRTMTAAAVIVLLAIGGVPAQQAYRRMADGHGEDTRAVAREIASRARPGDAVLFVPNDLRILASASPGEFARVQDVTLLLPGIASDTFSGVEVPADRVAARMAGSERIWVVTGGRGLAGIRAPIDEAGRTDEAKVRTLTAEYVLIDEVRGRPFRVALYERATS